MKQANKERLQVDLIRICDQIGILPNERPKLIFNTKEMNELDAQHSDVQSQRAICSDVLGKCFHSLRTGYVRESPLLENGTVGREEHYKNNKRYRSKIIRKKWNYSEQLNTLVHELVHYRFTSLPHGWTFDERIRDILRGKTFEQKHLHWFEGYLKKHTILIDGSSNEEIEKYYKTQGKAKATRAETRQKNIEYYKLYNELSSRAKALDYPSKYDLEDFLKKNHRRSIPVDTRIMRSQRKQKELWHKFHYNPSNRINWNVMEEELSLK